MRTLPGLESFVKPNTIFHTVRERLETQAASISKQGCNGLIQVNEVQGKFHVEAVGTSRHPKPP